MRIRRGIPADATAISRLVTELSQRFITPDLSSEGRRTLLETMTPAKVRGYLREAHVFHVVEEEGRLVGVVAIRGARHLYYLYVAEPFQRRGLARRLWDTAREEAVQRPGTGPFTVNASRYAVPVYERLGFERSGPENTFHGVVTTPMTWRVGE